MYLQHFSCGCQASNSPTKSPWQTAERIDCPAASSYAALWSREGGHSHVACDLHPRIDSLTNHMSTYLISRCLAQRACATLAPRVDAEDEGIIPPRLGEIKLRLEHAAAAAPRCPQVGTARLY
jgi:hypothetical protein